MTTAAGIINASGITHTCKHPCGKSSHRVNTEVLLVIQLFIKSKRPRNRKKKVLANTLFHSGQPQGLSSDLCSQQQWCFPNGEFPKQERCPRADTKPIHLAPMADFLQLSRQGACHGYKTCCAAATPCHSCGRLGKEEKSSRAVLNIPGLRSERHMQPLLPQ